MQAEATNQGIKITVPQIETTDKYAFFDTLRRGDYQSNYTSINNLNKLGVRIRRTDIEGSVTYLSYSFS